MAEAPTRAGPTLLTTANTAQAIYTAGGAGTWAIVRDITVVNETSGAVIVTYGIYTSAADAAGRRLANNVTLAAGGEPFTWGGMLPLLGGSTPDVLYALCNTTNGATVTLGLITGP